MKESCFESLSDEVLIHIFGYFNASDLFHAFHAVNDRFNRVLHALTDLHLIVTQSDSIVNLDCFSASVHTLITQGDARVHIDHFNYLRRLILHSPTDRLLQQFDRQLRLPYLEQLVVAGILCSLPNVHATIFSNHFPNLSLCHLSSFETIETLRPWTFTPSLRILKIGLIDFHTYKAVLRACPWM